MTTAVRFRFNYLHVRPYPVERFLRGNLARACVLFEMRRAQRAFVGTVIVGPAS